MSIDNIFQTVRSAQRQILTQPGHAVWLGYNAGALMLAKDGWKVDIIDLKDEKLVRAADARTNLRLKNVRLAEGNYIPLDIRLNTLPHPNLKLQDAQDPFYSLGPINQYDLFFIDPNEGQMNPVFDLVEQYAKPKAILIATGDEVNWQCRTPKLQHLGSIPTTVGRYNAYRKD